MKHYLLALPLFLLTCGLFAQPINDDCSGLIDLGVAPICPENVFYTNVGATASDIGFGNVPACFNGGGTQRDVWFAFTTSDTIFDYTITVTGLTDGVSPGMINPQIALYRGDCQVDGLAELACITAENGETVIELDVEGLTPNIPYYIRINDYSASATPNAGTFQLCVTETPPASNIDEGGSTACTGVLYDTGGEDGDYSNNENHTFTICPNQPHECITLTLQYYNIQETVFGNTDQLIFYDADSADPNSIISAINGSAITSGGGAVCYQVQASSGCLTVQFISDASVTFEGFAGAWECSAQPCEDPDPIIVEDNITNQQIVDFISTPFTTVTIDNINCPDRAYGIFQAPDNSDLGLERGLLLTSGDVNWAPGPNDDGGGGNPNATNLAPGDPDLDYLSTISGNGSLSNDACIIEIDVFAATNELTFEYVFASEEYPEFVNQSFNDIFAFLISGPGIVGDPNIGNQLNIAVLPDGNNTPVQINSVNNLTNWEYYRNNDGGQSLQYDGLTSDLLGVKKSLTARAEVIPCNTYHLKLAIADRSDFVWDSGVFISELRGGTPNLNVVYNSGIDYLLEDCTTEPDQVRIQLSNAIEDPITYNVVVSGTATPGVDYLLNIPTTITFQPGQTEVFFPIQPLSDLIDEPIETIIIQLVNNFGCGDVVYTTLTIELRDELEIEVQGGVDTALVCANSSLQLFAEGASEYFWTPINIFSNPFVADPVVTPPTSMWVQVEGKVGPICTDVDSIFLQIVDPQISLEASGTTNICRGASVQLAAINNVNNSNLQWTPTIYLNNPNTNTPVSTPFTTTTYIASVEVAGCVVSDTLTINVDPFDVPELIGDTLICQNYSIVLAEFIDQDTTTTQYSWSPTTGLDDPTSSAPLATPQQTTTYTLTTTSASGFCSQTDQVTVTVAPADVDIQAPDSVFICLGEVVNLSAVTSTGAGNGLIWSPDNGTLDTLQGLSVIATPTESTLYLATFNVAQCTVFDSIFIKVDSLPTGLITAIPDKEIYCQGDIVTFISNTYEPGHFPDIDHQWLPGPGFESGDSLWNLVITALDTFTYQRVTTNNACVDTSEITINVVEARAMSILPEFPRICQGQSIQLTLEYDGQGAITWEPPTNLSCTDCYTPTANPSATTTYNVSAEIGGCTQQAGTTVVVVPPPVTSLIPNPTICDTETTPVQLNFTDEDIDYVWTSPGNPAFSSDDPFLAVLPTQTTTYVLTAQNECFTVQDTVTVFVVSEPDLTVSSATICAGDPVTLTASSNLQAGAQESFTWSYNGNTQTGASITITGLNQTTDVQLDYVYGNNCGTLTEVVTVTVIGDEFGVDIEISPADTVISKDSILLTAVVTPPNAGIATYTWFEDGVQIGQTTTPTFSHIAPFVEDNNGTLFTYSVTVTSVEGCNRSDESDILVLPARFRIPNIFTPDANNRNDVFKVFYKGGYTIESFKVYNRWGQLVYEGSGDSAGWDGTYKNEPAPSEVYIYRIIMKLGDLEYELKGDVTLIR